jgi:5'-3' exonuclease/DNA polymerase I-like protein with 3'-5' exonuclease and polymerase domains
MKVILDLRGLALHAYFMGKDPDAWMEGDDEMKTVAHTLSNFLEEYLLPICKEHSIFDIIAVHEGGNQYRKSIFPGYKEGRDFQYTPAKSANIRESAKAVEALLIKLGILSVRYDGVEGDDVIAYLCQKLPGEKIIHTVDKDMIQLASDSVRVFLKNQEEVDIVDDAGNVVPPWYIALYKSIVGDKSDAYGGVPKVGPAGYRDLFKLLNEGAVVTLLEKERTDLLKTVDHPVAKKLVEHADLWKTCYQLAKLHPEECERTFRVSGVGVEAVYRYRRPEWNKELPQVDKIGEFLEGHKCVYLTEELKGAHLIPGRMLVDFGTDRIIPSVLKWLEEEPYVSIDFETASPPNENFTKAARGKDFVDVYGSEIVSMGLTVGRHAQHTFYFTFDHKETDDCKNLPLEVLDSLIKAVPEENTFIIQNLGFERCLLLNTRGIEINSIHDSLLMASYVDENKPLPEYLKAVYDRVDDDEDESEEDILGIVDPTELAPSGSYKSKARSGWDLKFMARRYLGYAQTEYSSVVPKGQTMRGITAHEAFHYGADDPFVTIHLYWYLRTILELEGTWGHVRDFEFPAACLISDAFVDGLSLDDGEMFRQSQEDRKLLDELLAKMRTAIKENQTAEMVDEGVLNLYRELSEEVKAKAGFEKISVEEFRERAMGLMEKLRETVPYADYARKEKEHKFDVTPGKLEAICAAFGLPVEPEREWFSDEDGEEWPVPTEEVWLKDLKPETVQTYYAFCYKQASLGLLIVPGNAMEFLRLLRLCSEANEFTPKRRGATYQELRDHCYEAWKNALPDDKRYEYTGFEFNLGSPAQKKLLMYGMLNLPRVVFNPKVSKTRQAWGMATGPVQTNKEAISDAMANSLSRDDWRWQVLEDLTTAQRCQTRLSLFYSVWPLYVHPLDGNVHPGIRSVGTETHRPSGNNPNALQLPKRGDGKKVRKCIVPNRKFYPREEAA